MEQFFNLPYPVRVVLAMLTGTSIVGGVAMIDTKLAGIVAIGLVLLVIAIAAFLFIRAVMRRRKAQSMANELTQHSASAPAGVNDAARRARLDDMRRTFGEGLAKFGSADNIYKFPWYLIVGEPGSGKTEAIRHSNVGFPPGLQNELQGVGGTINMNWWFSNQAVFLDTAGRLMFEEVKPGETNEWREFLQLLVRNRPNCPINGLLLIIPTDALIKDTEAKMNEKAGKIAAQFDLIQRTLDIRFPVFVMITKCDMMSGFREFFDDFADAASVNQMLGWSNPEDRDAPFQPDRVTDHLATVVQRIKKRRLSLLRDPVPCKGEERRTDEVDALYSLPQSIQLLAPRLRQYLEKIFVAGPWSPKPLFLRGIYFTSSMREGAALDQELAQALGLSADQLSEAKVWEKERAYFLRDIFTEKVFRERGLVTRATNTKRMLRKRGLLLWGTASLLALAFVGFTIYAYEQFAESIKRHSDLWSAAKNPEDWKDGRWKPIVQGDKPGETVLKFRGAEPPLTVGDRRMPLLTYHDELREVATKPIETGWVYRPMLRAAKLDEDRHKAQRIVYEASVVYPLVQAARTRMQNEKITDAVDAGESQDARLDREAHALAALLRIESDKVTGSRKLDDLSDIVLVPLLQYVTASKVPADAEKLKQLRAGFEATYGANPSAKWEPEHLALGSVTLEQNAPIQAGLGRLRSLAGESIRSQLDSAAKIVQMRDDLRKFRDIEREMDATASGPGETTAKEEKLTALLAQLGTVKTAFDAKLKAARDGNLITGEKISLSTAYQQVVTASQAQSNANFQLLRDAVKPNLAHPTAKLFKEVDDELAKTLANLTDQVKGTFNDKDREELTQLDTYLDDFGDRRRIYEVRYATYMEAADVASKTDKTDELIGKSWASYGAVVKEIDGQRSQLPKIQLKLLNPAAKDNPGIENICTALLKVAEERRLSAIARDYLRQTSQKFDAGFFEPLVSESGRKSGFSMSKSERQAADRLIELWKLDRDSPDFQKADPVVKGKLTALFSQFDAMKTAAAAYDDYWVKRSAMRATVTFRSQSPYKWKTANGSDIFNASDFSRTVGYGESVGVTLRDNANAPFEGGVTINTGEEGEQRVRSGGATLVFEVKFKGERPPPFSGLPKGPPKPPISAKLR
ncbi:MAG: type VI secretion protein IcmF/TssM N-terminal domain-containing protein [Chthoniobacteraceae bacterium]